MRGPKAVRSMRVERAGTAFTSRWQKGAVFRSPMAHGDGNYFADDTTRPV